MQGRFTTVSELARVNTWSVDLNGDGRNDIFVGSAQPWNGDSFQIYCAVYTPSESGYARVTGPETAIEVDPRFFGPRETSFCGYIEEQQTQGLLVLENDSVSRDPNDPQKPIRPEQYSSRRLYHIRDGRLNVDSLGPLDLGTPEGKAFLRRYFDEGVKSRPIRFEDYPIDKLKEHGYTIPDWKQPPAPSSMQAAPQRTIAPVVKTPAPVSEVKLKPSPTARVEAKQPPASFPILPVAMIAMVIVGMVLFWLRRNSS
jgi:hypothetical protein